MMKSEDLKKGQMLYCKKIREISILQDSYFVSSGEKCWNVITIQLPWKNGGKVNICFDDWWKERIILNKFKPFLGE